MDAPDLLLSCTAVRIPTLRAHSEGDNDRHHLLASYFTIASSSSSSSSSSSTHIAPYYTITLTHPTLSNIKTSTMFHVSSHALHSSHSNQAITLETEKKISATDVREMLRSAPGDEIYFSPHPFPSSSPFPHPFPSSSSPFPPNFFVISTL